MRPGGKPVAENVSMSPSRSVALNERLADVPLAVVWLAAAVKHRVALLIPEISEDRGLTNFAAYAATTK